MADDAATALARLREEVITAANGFVPALSAEQAYAAGAFRGCALKALDGLGAALELAATWRETAAVLRKRAAELGDYPRAADGVRLEAGDLDRSAGALSAAILAALTGKEVPGEADH